MKKRLLVLSLVFILICNIGVCFAASKVTMYSLDGRQLNVWDYEVDAYVKVGWYTQPMTKMYALDGRTTIVPTSFVEENKKVGWYTELPRVTMYALDGRQISVLSTELEAYKNVGWYTEPMTMMYAIDGRTMIVPTSFVEENKKVGWYTQPMTKMYALDGRTMIVPTSFVEENKKVGWYTQPMTMMYSRDGRTMIVPTSFVEENKKVGWYTTPQNNTNYKKAYTKILESKLKEPHEKYDEPTFSLCYINNDNIPELVYSTNQFHYMGAEVYTFDGLKAVKLSHYETYDGSLSYLFGSNGTILYRERENLFISHYWGMGEYLTVFKIADNKAVVACNLRGEEDGISDVGLTYKYYVDGTKVSFSKYMQTRKNYGFTGAFYTSNGYLSSADKNHYTLTSANIKKVLGN